VGILRRTPDIVIRAIVIARVRGCGWWMMGAFRDTLFQASVEFLGRRDNDRIYPVPIVKNEQIAMGDLALDRDAEQEVDMGGQPPGSRAAVLDPFPIKGVFRSDQANRVSKKGLKCSQKKSEWENKGEGYKGWV
jgi:hypothetical protein